MQLSKFLCNPNHELKKNHLNQISNLKQTSLETSHFFGNGMVSYIFGVKCQSETERNSKRFKLPHSWIKIEKSYLVWLVSSYLYFGLQGGHPQLIFEFKNSPISSNYMFMLIKLDLFSNNHHLYNFHCRPVSLVIRWAQCEPGL